MNTQHTIESHVSALFRALPLFRKLAEYMNNDELEALVSSHTLDGWKEIGEYYDTGFHDLHESIIRQFQVANCVNRYHDNNDELEGYLKVSVNSLLSKYYGTDITINWDRNAPKLAKQLDKLGIVTTEAEWKVIKELPTILANFAETPYLLLADDELDPDEMDSWAFANSCNSTGGDGFNTWHYLAHNHFNLIKMEDCDGTPISRVIYYEHGDDFVHAGCYSNMELLGYIVKEGNKEDSTAYPLATMLLCILHGRKIDEVERQQGFRGTNREAGIWANLGNDTDYKKYGTCDLFYGWNLEMPELEGVLYSNYLDGYLLEDDATYADNADDFVPSSCSYLENCYNCGAILLTDSDYDDLYLYDEEGDRFFCDEYCAGKYGVVVD